MIGQDKNDQFLESNIAHFGNFCFQTFLDDK
jgi:hypothetical protein